MHKQTNALFLTCLDNKSKLVVGGLMLPNTQHMPPSFNRKNYKKDLLLHLAKNHLAFIDTAKLVLDIDQQNAYLLPKRDVPKGKEPTLFSFNAAKHRFSKGNMDFEDFSKAQQEYLNSKIISHAWAAIHNGLVVGMAFFPILKDHRPNNPKFLDYLSQTNVLMKKIGYFVSGDLVITKDGKLKFFRVLKNRRIGSVIYKNWTQELILTNAIKSFEEE